MCYTKGHIRTKVVTETIIKNAPLSNQNGTAQYPLREFLQMWENLAPTKLLLLNEMKQDLENIKRELEHNLLTLNVEVTGQNLGNSRLNTDVWRQLYNENRPYDEKIRWFLIRSESNLEQELKELYNSIDHYDSLIDDVVARGDFRTPKNFTIANEERNN